MRRRDVVIGGAALAAGCAGVSSETRTTRPIVIAHRGASGERPEHTLAAYRLAIAQGADFIEPDLVMTKDGVLVCRHENEIGGTTDVSARPEFADRRNEKIVDGVTATGWWVEDFTLAELKTLRCKERLPQLRPANMAFDGQEAVPTFAEVLALAREANVGVYPELKHPTFLREQGLDPVEAFISAVQEAGGQRAADMMYVQCFESLPLLSLASVSSIRFQCIQLIGATGGPWDLHSEGVTYAQWISPLAMRSRHEWEHLVGIGVEKSLLIPRDADGRSLPATDLVQSAHEIGLQVHPWTFRVENYFLPAELRVGDASAPDYMRQHGDLAHELAQFYALGVDGVFCDFPAAAVAARG
jgi:glycerophosphoryl diester phosphodiesterase